MQKQQQITLHGASDNANTSRSSSLSFIFKSSDRWSWCMSKWQGEVVGPGSFLSPNISCYQTLLLGVSLIWNHNYSMHSLCWWFMKRWTRMLHELSCGALLMMVSTSSILMFFVFYVTASTFLMQKLFGINYPYLFLFTDQFLCRYCPWI